MTTNLPATLAEAYPATVRPIKGSSRIDVEVAPITAVTAAGEPDFLTRLRTFFAEMDAEIDRHAQDPVALTNALARIETLLADVRYLSTRIKDRTAAALNAAQIRRLTIAEVATVEASTNSDRTDWRHEALLGRVLADAILPHVFANGPMVDEPMDPEPTYIDGNGERVGLAHILDSPAAQHAIAATVAPHIAHALLEYVRLEWRLTPLREHGIDPDAYSTIERDDDGKPVRTPTVRVVDNAIRTNGATQ